MIIASWVMAIMSATGVVLNIYKNKWCFVLWGITNLFWTIFDFIIGAYAQSALFAFYFGLAIWGLIKWSRKK